VYEATNPSFSGATLVYNSTGTSVPLVGRGNGTWYYEVQACNSSGCSAFTAGANGVTVTLPPPLVQITDAAGNVLPAAASLYTSFVTCPSQTNQCVFGLIQQYGSHLTVRQAISTAGGPYVDQTLVSGYSDGASGAMTYATQAAYGH